MPRMIKFIQKQEQTNRLIKEFSKSNYKAALHWATHEKHEVERRNLHINPFEKKNKTLTSLNEDIIEYTY